MVSFQVERFADFIGEAAPLLQRHWEELALNKERVPLRIDHLRYAALEDRGQHLICTARAGSRLIGYAAYFVEPHGPINYTGKQWAESNVFWLHPEFRVGRTALKLLLFAEEELRRRSTFIMRTRTKIEHPAAGRMLEHLGHKPIETVYSKVLL